MSILQTTELAKAFGAQDLFSGVSLRVAAGDRIALVGSNGAGKTTLLRILAGVEEPSGGHVHRARGLTVGYLPQKPHLQGDQSLYQAMLAPFAHLRRRQADLQALAEQLADQPESEELLARYAEVEHRFDLDGGYRYESEIRRVLGGLGFGPETYDQPLAQLSGGQITRAALARLLLENAQLLLLDEPTNYLDLQALEWLEGYLQAWTHSLVVVSHDRYFLDRVATRVWELEHGRLETYRGNYSHYVQQREERLARQWREYKEQQQYISETEEFIRRYKAGQRSKEARGREKRLDRLERIERPQQQKSISLRLSTRLRAGDRVLATTGITVGYPPSNGTGGALFSTGSLLMLRGQRVALLGPNGSGKTTLLRTILGEHRPLTGQIRLGASVRLGYLPQRHDWLQEDRTVLDHVLDAADLTYEEARALLGRLLFADDDVRKQAGQLSGGERSRLGLALLTIKGANLLLLDEPTTHLDLHSQEVLQSVLEGFEGTILFVSHDRYLVDALATHMWAIADGRLQTYEGGYSAYIEALQHKGAARDARASREGPMSDEARRHQRRGERELRRQAARSDELEAEIARLEQRLAELAAEIERAGAGRDVERVQALGHAYQESEATLAARLQEWEALASALVD